MLEDYYSILLLSYSISSGAIGSPDNISIVQLHTNITHKPFIFQPLNQQS